MDAKWWQQRNTHYLLVSSKSEVYTVQIKAFPSWPILENLHIWLISRASNSDKIVSEASPLSNTKLFQHFVPENPLCVCTNFASIQVLLLVFNNFF